VACNSGEVAFALLTLALAGLGMVVLLWLIMT
jgi:hypothetical protein